MHSGVRDWNLSVGASDGNLARGLNFMTYTSMFHFRTAADTVEVVFEGSQDIPLERDRVRGVPKRLQKRAMFEACVCRNNNSAALGEGRTVGARSGTLLRNQMMHGFGVHREIGFRTRSVANALLSDGIGVSPWFVYLHSFPLFLSCHCIRSPRLFRFPSLSFPPPRAASDVRRGIPMPPARSLTTLN